MGQRKMETTLITELERVEHIYKTYMKKDFPRSELKPFASIRRMWEQHSYDCYQMTENRYLTGYAFFVKRAVDGKFDYLLDYLAVVREYRGAGYGSEFLKQLFRMITDAGCMVVEVEDPDRAEDEAARIIQERRLSFYLKNGFVQTGITATIFGVPYRILEFPYNIRHTADKIQETYTSLYRYMVPAPLYQLNIRIN